jgi:predicted negative regulator of RcsB-dependent stress response
MENQTNISPAPQGGNSSGANTVLLVVVIIILGVFGWWWYNRSNKAAPKEENPGINIDVNLPQGNNPDTNANGSAQPGQ